MPDHLRETRRPDLGSLRLDPRNYTCPEFHRKEVEHLWKRAWQLACWEEDIPAIGDHITCDVADMSLIIVRTSETDIKAFYNSCLHGGRRLVSEQVNKVSSSGSFHYWKGLTPEPILCTN